MCKELKYLSLTFTIFLSIIGCEEKIVNQGDVVPKIEFKSISKNKVKQFTDSIAIVLSYFDGDGDLGEVNPDSLSLCVRDTRLSKPDNYHIMPLSPVGYKINIHGDITIKLKNLFLLSPSPAETTSFEIKVKDRANHFSNLILTPKIEIIR